MIDPAQAKFRAAISEHFGELFADHGFAFVAERNERSGECQMQIAASQECQIKFTLEQDSFALRFGRSDAPRIWRDDVEDVVVWHAVQTLMMFEDTLHPGEATSLPRSTGEVTLDRTLQSYASLLRSYMPRLLAAFSPRPPAGWWAAYAAWQAARIGG